MAQTTHPYLFDTTVFVDYLRGVPQAKTWVERVVDREIKGVFSIISEAELWAGVKDGKDEKRHKVLLAYFIRIPFQVTTARRAGNLYHACRKTNGIGLADCLIAASAEYAKADIVTRNTRHYHSLTLDGIHVAYYSL